MTAANPHADALSAARPFAVFLALTLVVAAGNRLLLMTLHAGHVESVSAALTVLANGARVDIALASMLILPLFLVYLCLPGFLQAGIFEAVATAWLLAGGAIVVFMETVTPTYMDFFGMRPGRIFFEYLNRPGEVFGLLFEGYLLASVVAVLLPITVIGWLWRSGWMHVSPIGRLPARFMLVLLIPLLALGARSSLGHRPLNPSMVAFSGDQMVNEMVLNSTYSLAYAVYSLRHERFGENDYGDLAPADVVSTFRRSLRLPDAQFEEGGTTERFFPAVSGRRKNIVVIVEESLGARFVGSLGGLPLTPNIDALSREGLWFTNLFATGIRSARGLEAIVAGFPPSASRSVLKLSGSQNGFYTFARTLEEKGYTNLFFYGGESHFDNMKGFFLANGFHEAYDIEDMEDAEFVGVWGASDGDLFRFADRHLKQQREPFFALMFSSSFHTPFEFPDGEIELYETPKQTRLNAVKYADHALGEYIRAAKASNYWDDTLFLIVADHDERPSARDLVPVDSYRIPGLILGEGVPQREEGRVVSQIDLMPTLLSLAGVSFTAPAPGYSVLRLPDDEPGRAVMQYGNNHAFMRGNRIAVHQPGKPAQTFTFDGEALSPAPDDAALQREGLAWAKLPGLLYRDGYRIAPAARRSHQLASSRGGQ